MAGRAGAIRQDREVISDPVSALAFVLAVGVGGQWIAARLGFPAIVVMLGSGLLVGPAFGLLDPDEAFGPILDPMIGLGVGVLLFEGGLSLKWNQIGTTTRRVVVRLLTVGAAVSFVLATTAAIVLTQLPNGVAVLFGAIMVVTGPTVVIPLLRQARLRPRVGRILRWEGIIVDPVGAVLGVCVLEVLLLDDGTVGEAAWTLARITFVGCAVGAAIAAALVVVLDRHLVPDHLREVLALVAAVGAYAIANELAHDAGLYAVTVAGIALANQRRVAIQPIQELHEHLSTLILAGVFVVLAARVDPQILGDNLLPAALLLVALVLVVRPAAVAVSTVGTSLSTRERAYLAALAPRGIVAASVSAVFGASLTAADLPGGEELAAITFLVVCGTVVVYGLLARPMARVLRTAMPDPTGVVLVGARRWARALGVALSDAGVPVMVLAEDEANAEEARSLGLLVYQGTLEGEELSEAVEAVGARLAVVGSGAEALDAVAVERVVHVLGRSQVFRVARDEGHQAALSHGGAVEGRYAFDPLTQEALDDLMADGAQVAVLEPGERASHRERPLLVIDGAGAPSLMAGDGGGVGPSHRLVVIRLPG
jgi:NhaP-type Na+/H+ or K+/H+ antiporter